MERSQLLLMSLVKMRYCFSSRKLTRKPIKRWEFVGQLLEDYPLNGRLLVDESGNRIPASQNGYRYINFI